MCPMTMTAISMAVAAASAIASHRQQEQQAKAQVNYQEAQGKAHNEAIVQNAKNAIREQTEQSTAERMAQMQTQEATGQKMFDLQTERLKAQGEAAASSRAAGTAFDMLMADYNRVQAQKKGILAHQREMSGVQSDLAVQGLRDKADSRLNSQQGFIASSVSRPSWGITALGIAGNAADKTASYTLAKKKATDAKT